jgi:hypothetical protein
MNFCQGELVVILKLNTMKTIQEILTGNGVDNSTVTPAIMKAIRDIVIMSYDEGFKYASEKFRIEPEGKPVKSVGQFYDFVFNQNTHEATN